MTLPNRSGSVDSYRYGFQGQEKDDEVKDIPGSSINFTFRMYDSRIGRFFAVDPLTSDYPFYSPYSFSGNKVISHKELEGGEEMQVIGDFETGEPNILTATGKKLVTFLVIQTINGMGARSAERSYTLAFEALNDGHLMFNDGSVRNTTRMVEKEIFMIDGSKQKAMMGVNIGFTKDGDKISSKGLNQIELFRPNRLIRASKLVELAGISKAAFDLVDTESGQLNPSAALEATVAELAALAITRSGITGFKANLATLLVDIVFISSDIEMRMHKSDQEATMISSIINGHENMSSAMKIINNNSIEFENGSTFEMLSLQNNSIEKLLKGEITDLTDLRFYDLDNGNPDLPTGAVLIQYPKYGEKVNILSIHIGTNEKN